MRTIGLLLAMMMASWARPGGCSIPLEPGLFLAYRMELISDGQRREESLTLSVEETAAAGGPLRVELSLGGGEFRYRVLYDPAGDGPVFAASRFTSVEAWEDGWVLKPRGEVELLATLQAVEARAALGEAIADSVISVGNIDLACTAKSFVDSSESVQSGETVTIRIVERLRGRLYRSDEIPFGGWVRYEEERSARKLTEFSGRSFVGDESHTRETWTLVEHSRH